MKLPWDPDCYPAGTKRWWHVITAQKKRILNLALEMIVEVWTNRYLPGEKVILHYVMVCYLSSANQPTEELIKVHARYLADIEDLIWDNREGVIARHLGIR